MATEQRLTKLEKQAALIPRTGAALVRIAEATPVSMHDEWLKKISDTELDSYMAELDRIAAANDEPVYDLSRLSDDELQRVINGDETPLVHCPLVSTVV